ncbi:hypothetical protein BDB00DRAFT_855546 [Zychaea mexicana]|uniref:uncharacterized protein n=1 Tax=Zychaea mexicana TaxID=64656 RepID=UPI0022FEE6BC|nr:uncharacterized protein BDB00DRAFT_855546 [Zychaea mexicana]KAI9484465.1 hypothetical protein BDB00DRAFT_855546 [Zychaea mexicana]
MKKKKLTVRVKLLGVVLPGFLSLILLLLSDQEDSSGSLKSMFQKSGLFLTFTQGGGVAQVCGRKLGVLFHPKSYDLESHTT